MSKAPTKPRKAAPRAAASPRRFTLTTAWAAGLLALLTVLFFHQVALEGMTFGAPDATQPVGFVRMGEQSLYHDHVYPLWNPFVFLGMPSFASGAYNPLIYPPDWPLALIAKVVPLPDLTWLLLYYFLLAREWGARPEGALLGAVAFVFAPNLVAVGSHGHGSQLVDSAYIPLLLWLVARWMRRGGLHHLGWLALAGGFQMLRGHAQIAFYTWIAVALYLLVDLLAGLPRRAAAAEGETGPALATRLARAGGVVVAMGLAFGIAGFYNLPLRDYSQYSIRGGGADGGVGMDYATMWSLSGRELPTLVVPGAVGFGGPTYWGTMPFTDYPNAYVGMITVVLALPALLALGPARVYALVLAAVAMMVAFGKHFPLYGFLYDHLPLFNKFRIPVMILVLFQVATALGLAWGWSAMLDPPAGKRPDPRARRLLLGAGLALLATLLAAALGQEGWRTSYLAAVHAARSDLPVQAAEAAFRGFLGDLIRVSLLGLGAVAVAFLALTRRLSAGLASLIVLVLLIGELWPVSGQVMAPVIAPRVPQLLDQGRDDVVEFFEKVAPVGTFRVLPIDEFQSNRFAGFGVASIGGYHAAKPRLFQDLVEINAFENPYWMRLLNIRYLVTPQPLEIPQFHAVFQGSAIVLENPTALPRVTLVTEYRVASPRAIVDSIGKGAVDPALAMWLEQDPHLTLGPASGGRATIVRYRLNDVAIDVDAPAPALLRLADLWYPDWRATVDGKPVPILRADYLLRAVPVPAGKHRVEFRFESPAVRTGLTVSLVSLAAVLALLAAGFVASRRSRSPIASAEAG
jgi:membrane protein YfhO